MQFLDTDQYLCPARSSRHDQRLLCEQFIEMCDGWITASDAVIIRLSPSWSPVKDKETPVARLTLSDRLCEKQPWAHAQGFTAPSFRLLEQGREVWHWVRWQLWPNSWKTTQRKVHPSSFINETLLNFYNFIMYFVDSLHRNKPIYTQEV